MAPEVKTAKNSKLPKLSENCFELVGKGGWPPISIWIIHHHNYQLKTFSILGLNFVSFLWLNYFFE
jgi:hypothetical protein